jgi:hypothetical protein
VGIVRYKRLDGMWLADVLLMACYLLDDFK